MLINAKLTPILKIIKTTDMYKQFLSLTILILLLISACTKQKDNKIFKGYQKGAWECTDTTNNWQNIIFEDTSNTVIITSQVIIGSPEYFGKKNKAGVLSFFNFSTDPIELNQVFFDNEGKSLDTLKLYIQFIGKDTLQMTKNKGVKKDENYFSDKSDTVYTFVKTDTISTIPATITDVTSTIYKLYSNFSFNIATMDNIDTDKIPVYGNMLEISLGLGMMRMYTMNYSFDAGNIQILKLSEKEATVSYTLNIMESEKVSKQKEVVTKLKKINNEWRVYWKDIFGTGTL